jgi:FixJ family two-component response regulator
MNLLHTLSAHTSASCTTPVVSVIDSDAAVRSTLEPLLRSAGYEVRLLAAAEDFLAQPREMLAGCLLVELDLPGLSGLDLQQRVFGRAELPIIFMSRNADVPTTVRAMKGGAFEFLTKPVRREVLLDAIAGAIERSHAALRHLNQVHALQERYGSLSRREREVMSLVVSGRLNKQVGGDLGISEITVKAHRGKMMRKMRASSFAELVTMAASLRGDARVGA